MDVKLKDFKLPSSLQVEMSWHIFLQFFLTFNLLVICSTLNGRKILLLARTDQGDLVDLFVQILNSNSVDVIPFYIDKVSNVEESLCNVVSSQSWSMAVDLVSRGLSSTRNVAQVQFNITGAGPWGARGAANVNLN